MIKGIYGVNIAVSDLEAATKKYEAFLGIEGRPVGPEYFAFPGLLGSQFNVNGFCINLITSTQPDTSVATFLERKGEGLFLLSVEVDDIEADVAKAREQGLGVILDKNAKGDFGAVNFIHPKTMAGVQVEVFQPSSGMSMQTTE